VRKERVVDTGLEYGPGAPVVADELVVNVSRQGVVSLPVVRVGPQKNEIVGRIGEASLALYQELLELESPASFRR